MTSLRLISVYGFYATPAERRHVHCFRAAIPCDASSTEELIYTVRWVYQHPNGL